MLIETFLSPMATEHMNAGWGPESIITTVILIIWIIIWIAIIIHAIRCAKSKKPLRNTQAGILLSVFSWPFYILFYLTGAINN